MSNTKTTKLRRKHTMIVSAIFKRPVPTPKARIAVIMATAGKHGVDDEPFEMIVGPTIVDNL